MKYYTIISIFVCLFLTACNPDLNTNEKRTPSKGMISNQDADSNKRIKNKLLDDLINLIEKANADREKYVKKWKKNLRINMECWLFLEVCIGQNHRGN